MVHTHTHKRCDAANKLAGNVSFGVQRADVRTTETAASNKRVTFNINIITKLV